MESPFLGARKTIFLSGILEGDKVIFPNVRGGWGKKRIWPPKMGQKIQMVTLAKATNNIFVEFLFSVFLEIEDIFFFAINLIASEIVLGI